MYVVTSFDFGGTSNVKLHAVTADEALAQEVYASVLNSCNLINSTANHGAARALVELTQIPADTKLLGADARTLFWGGDAQNNNCATSHARNRTEGTE